MVVFCSKLELKIFNRNVLQMDQQKTSASQAFRKVEVLETMLKSERL